LLALVLLHDARRSTRVDAEGDLVPLEEQDRTRWDHGSIDDAVAILERALRRRSPGPYQVQAAIAACHATAPTPDVTDWAEIAALYRELARMVPSPVVELNRAVAVAEAGAPEAALRIVDSLDLGDYQYLHSTRGELLRRLGRREEARASFRRALELAASEPERRFLAQRLAEL
jgi:RNA polymerase sigma-70 factor (ECF subfamily)